MTAWSNQGRRQAPARHFVNKACQGLPGPATACLRLAEACFRGAPAGGARRPAQLFDRFVKPRPAEAGGRSPRAGGARRPAWAGHGRHGTDGRGTFAPTVQQVVDLLVKPGPSRGRRPKARAGRPPATAATAGHSRPALHGRSRRRRRLGGGRSPPFVL